MLIWIYTCCALYVVATLMLAIFQRHIIYRSPDKIYVAPEHSGIGTEFTEIDVTTADHLILKGWYSAPTIKKPVIIYFHGNGDSLRTSVHIAKPYIENGYGFLIAEYRGYSGLPGRPTEQNLYADARLFFERISRDHDDIILMGYSLGTGVALQLATEHRVAGVILIAPYLSIAAIARKIIPLLPVNTLLSDRYENHKKIEQISSPLFLAHGMNDRRIPVSHGKALYKLARDAKQSHFPSNRNHMNILCDETHRLILAWLSLL
jgi:fermentation-respiration switch protein FrsA (DUF1100 family)